MLPTTIKADTSPVVAVLFACMGGKFLLRDNNGFLAVVDNDGNVIGSAHTCNGGYAIHTAAYGGYAGPDEVVFVDQPQTD